MSIITVPFSWLLTLFYDTFQNYGLSIILFALLVNLILTPFMAKSKKSMLYTTRLQPRLKELEKRHSGNQQKYQQEVSKLYKEEGVNPMSGCLWAILPLLILIPLYSVIRQPMTTMMGMAQEQIDLVQSTLEGLGLLDAESMSNRTKMYLEILMTQLSHENYDAVHSVVSAVKDIDYSFLGLNLGSLPQLMFWNAEGFSGSNWWPSVGLFLIPVISAGSSWLTSKVSMAMNPPAGNDAQSQQMASTNKMMQIFMPLMMLWFTFTVPAAMGVYWIANGVFGLIRDVILTKYYRKKLFEDDEEWKERERRREREEAELERKREAAERRRATGEILENKNVSKKKLQAAEKQKAEEMKAAAIAADRAARREKLGIGETEVPPSQVGNRRYARGRAYDPDRFGKQEEVPAEAETVEQEESQESTL